MPVALFVALAARRTAEPSKIGHRHRAHRHEFLGTGLSAVPVSVVRGQELPTLGAADSSRVKVFLASDNERPNLLSLLACQDSPRLPNGMPISCRRASACQL